MERREGHRPDPSGQTGLGWGAPKLACFQEDAHTLWPLCLT